MDEAQIALWKQVQEEATKLDVNLSSFHISEDRYMLHGREVAVLWQIGSKEESPIDIYHIDTAFNLQELFSSRA